jgi:predicted nucleic acid-binding protein
MTYADTNFFTRNYLQLPDTGIALACVDTLREARAGFLPVTWLHRMEFVNALQLHVFADRRGGSLPVSPEQAAAAHAVFRADLGAGEFLEPAHVSMVGLENQFEELSLRHANKHGFRTYDLLHVAFALLLKSNTFWSFDQKANKLASLEGLKVLKTASIQS